MSSASLRSFRLSARMVRSFKALVLVSVTSLTLAGCNDLNVSVGANQSPSATTITVTSTAGAAAADETNSEEFVSDYVDLYQEVIDEPSSFPIKGNPDYEPRGTYSYVLMDATGDGLPELLLRIDSQEYSPVSIFTVDNGELVQSNGVLIDGAAGAGGHRLRLKGSQSGAGFYQIEYQSLSMDGDSTLYEFDGVDVYSTDKTEQFRLDAPLADHQEIEWIDTYDSSGLKYLGTSNTSAEKKAEPSDIPAYSPSNVEATHTFTGVVKEKTAGELMDGMGTPNGEPEDELHVVMELDSPMNITAWSSGGYDRNAFIEEISLPQYFGQDYVYDWSLYVGDRITIYADSEDVVFPSDTSLPLGMLRVVDFTDIEE